MSLKVTVYSDYICPFCYVAALRMERLGRELDLEVEWKGMEIHPETPSQGRVMPPELQAKLANPEGSVQFFAREEEMELKVPAFIPSSRLALEASEYAREQGKLAPFHRAVFAAYWEQGLNIGDSEVLRELAKQAGLDPEALETYLAEGKGRERLQANQQEAEERGVVGVPSFLFGDHIFLEGVQAYPVLKRAAEKALKAVGNMP